MSKYFKGIMVPVLTPFDENGNILEGEFRNHINILLKSGVHSFLIPSGTGEFCNLTFEQKELLVVIAAEEIKKKVPLVALVSDCSTENVLRLIEMAQKKGANEIMITPPYFSHVDQRALEVFFKKIADESKLPVWLYHQPGETKLSIDVTTAIKLSKHPNIVGIKVAAGEDFFYFCRLCQAFRNDGEFSILMGEDFGTLASYVMGGDGSVSSLANVIPEEFVEIFTAYNNGDLPRAKVLQDKIMDCFDALVLVDTGCFQSACKTILREKGIYSTNFVSSPYLPILKEEEKVVLKKAKKIGIL